VRPNRRMSAERKRLQGASPVTGGCASTARRRATSAYSRPGIIVAKSTAIVPHGRLGRAGFFARRRLFGAPLATAQEIHERLPKWKALAVFSSDVMSSVAYATEASMFTLLAAGSIAFAYLMPISFLIVGLLVLVTFSYRQTIRAYPNGGGSYIVARANLGTLPGLVAAAALLTDYVLTVAVSVSSGVFNLASAFPALHPDHRAPHRGGDPAGDGREPAGGSGRAARSSPSRPTSSSRASSCLSSSGRADRSRAGSPRPPMSIPCRCRRRRSACSCSCGPSPTAAAR